MQTYEKNPLITYGLYFLIYKRFKYKRSASISAGTPYAGGLFKMKLVLGKNFPSEAPRGYFMTKIFHPNVASNGEICVNTLKKDWTADLGIKQVLLVSVQQNAVRVFSIYNLLRTRLLTYMCIPLTKL